MSIMWKVGTCGHVVLLQIWSFIRRAISTVESSTARKHCSHTSATLETIISTWETFSCILTASTFICCKIHLLVPKLWSNISSNTWVQQHCELFTILYTRLRWCLFFGWIEKAKYFSFFYSAKNNLLTLSNIIKLNLLITNSF